MQSRFVFNLFVVLVATAVMVFLQSLGVSTTSTASYGGVVSAAAAGGADAAHDDNDNDNDNDDVPVEYVLVGVSGGLQMGFPEHFRMDYQSGQQRNEEVQAVFMGRALVRGYKSYLDVMEDGWRQYTPPRPPPPKKNSESEGEGSSPLINCNVIPTGCYHHANEYWIYLVDTRQFQTILFNEPRFLTIAPDLGLVDLTAEETSPVVRHVAYHEISRQNKTDTNYVAFPIVTGAWFNPSSHVPSPVLYTKEDGTEVTNFPQSLATWSGVIGDNLHKDKLMAMTALGGESFDFLESGEPSRSFFEAIAKRIRQGEAERHKQATISDAYSPSTYASKCTKKARFGVSSSMARVNYPFSPQDVVMMLEQGGFDIDFRNSEVTKSSSGNSEL